MDASSFVRCIQRDDISSLVALPGVGKKTAERLLIEMRDKLKDWLALANESDGTVATSVAVMDIVGDAEGALIALGYKPVEASRMVAAINDDTITDSEELIRLALKSTVKS